MVQVAAGTSPFLIKQGSFDNERFYLRRDRLGVPGCTSGKKIVETQILKMCAGNHPAPACHRGHQSQSRGYSTPSVSELIYTYNSLQVKPHKL